MRNELALENPSAHIYPNGDLYNLLVSRNLVGLHYCEMKRLIIVFLNADMMIH